MPAYPTYVVNDIDVNIRHLERRIRRIEEEARQLVRRHARLARTMRHLASVRGIGDKSAVALLGELLSMPEGLGVREWIVYAGLDVRRYESGRSVRAPGRTREGGQRPPPPRALHAGAGGLAERAKCAGLLRGADREGEGAASSLSWR